MKNIGLFKKNLSLSLIILAASTTTQAASLYQECSFTVKATPRWLPSGKILGCKTPLYLPRDTGFGNANITVSVGKPEQKIKVKPGIFAYLNKNGVELSRHSPAPSPNYTHWWSFTKSFKMAAVGNGMYFAYYNYYSVPSSELPGGSASVPVSLYQF